MTDKYANGGNVTLPKLTAEQRLAIIAAAEHDRRRHNDQFPKRDPRRVKAISDASNADLLEAARTGKGIEMVITS